MCSTAYGRNDSLTQRKVASFFQTLGITSPSPVTRRAGTGPQDVMPLRGGYHGDADHELGVRVQITRERLAQMTEQ